MPDIYFYGFDRNLNRNIDPLLSPLVYDSVRDTVQAQRIQLGALLTGSQNSMFVVDPARGLWLGDKDFADAPFRVNMQGDVTANSLTTTTGMSKVGQFATGVIVQNTTTETNLFSFTLNANSLSTANMVYGKIYLDRFSHNANTFTLRLYYGTATTSDVISLTTAHTGGISTAGYLDFWIIADGATNAQVLAFSAFAGQELSNTSDSTPTFRSNANDDGASAIDSTANQTVKITAQWTAADVSNIIGARSGFAFLIR